MLENTFYNQLIPSLGMGKQQNCFGGQDTNVVCQTSLKELQVLCIYFNNSLQ